MYTLVIMKTYLHCAACHFLILLQGFQHIAAVA